MDRETRYRPRWPYPRLPQTSNLKPQTSYVETNRIQTIYASPLAIVDRKFRGSKYRRCRNRRSVTDDAFTHVKSSIAEPNGKSTSQFNILLHDEVHLTITFFRSWTRASKCFYAQSVHKGSAPPIDDLRVQHINRCLIATTITIALR